MEALLPNSSICLEDLCEKYNYFILDCDGVLWQSEPIEGSFEALNYLQKSGKKVFFLTNSSAKSPAQYQEKLLKFGFKCNPEDVNLNFFMFVDLHKRYGVCEIHE
jgi:ribonucleotide monophosphatase NagD (HAD superfamily)